MADLKDSGERRAFGTGAVRDMAEGKGRCDLLPLGQVNELFFNMDTHCYDSVITHLDAFDRTGRCTPSYLYGALHSLCDKAFNGCMPTMILETSIHFEDGAKKYGEWNWQKGIPARCYLDSAIRHYLKWLRGDQDEPHHRACAWNLMSMIWELDHHPDQSIYEEAQR